MPERDKSEFRPSWTPDLGAWRVAVPELGEAGAEQRRPDLVHPPLLQDYLYDRKKLLSTFHEEKVQELWKSVQKGSLRDLDEAEAGVIIESLRVAYTGLWGKTTLRSLHCIRHPGQSTAFQPLPGQYERSWATSQLI